jgi:hypothetical protein
MEGPGGDLKDNVVAFLKEICPGGVQLLRNKLQVVQWGSVTNLLKSALLVQETICEKKAEVR